MSEQEFLNSISKECVVVDIEKYESMVSDVTVLTLIRQAVEKDNRRYDLLSTETTKMIEIILGLKGADEK